jgi:hypothetical protein
VSELVAPYLTGRHDGKPVNRVTEKRWTGSIKVKPWDRKVTATFAHLETPEMVPTVVDLLRYQSEPPHIIIVDTGSSEQACKELEANRAPDVEIHYIRSHAYRHPSQPVSAACDLAMSLITTEYAFWTHSDVFLRDRDYLRRTMAMCGPDTPVVGYEMSPRSEYNVSGFIGHTATMSHKPTLDRLGVTWSVERAYNQFGVPRGEMTGGWPDTEGLLNLILKEAGIKPVLIGKDTNLENFIDERIQHVRSFAGSKLYANDGSGSYHETAQGWLVEALSEAQERIARWKTMA